MRNPPQKAEDAPREKRKREQREREKRKEGGYVPHGTHGRVLEYSYTHVRIRVYIAKGSPLGGFSGTLFGMTSEARGSRTSNTDFSIARILGDDRRRSLPSVDRETARKRRTHGLDREHAFRGAGNEEAREADVDAEEAGREVSGGNVEGTSPDVATGRRSGGGNDGSAARRTDLTWLQYTRYRPPRLPRKSAAEKRMKRRTGEQPRIPFSSPQLRVLEDRYKRNAYLSRNDVVEMSATLRLPQNKIKIWFQNRRARQRRESLNSTILAR
ncbi:hypothetical protein DMN91_008959 [Ooceraea biroi]|uniref:Homeobox protein MSX-1 n=1 Tax=Ooceraea biroi TaxID=2015173 RepID=A0A026WFZ8_OOCBI|nr:homeobox protein MSX-2 [Ooceraea biroi]EZA54972.1 Homeobox protein MSX-1 [Ooceraea biroi]RLU18602.1 hypothetical protein DMN91_008959 [Ooceraea biroi]